MMIERGADPHITFHSPYYNKTAILYFSTSNNDLRLLSFVDGKTYKINLTQV